MMMMIICQSTHYDFSEEREQLWPGVLSHAICDSRWFW